MIKTSALPPTRAHGPAGPRSPLTPPPGACPASQPAGTVLSCVLQFLCLSYSATCVSISRYLWRRCQPGPQKATTCHEYLGLQPGARPLPPRLPNEKPTTAHTPMAAAVNESKAYLFFFCQLGKKTYFPVCGRIVVCTCSWAARRTSSVLWLCLCFELREDQGSRYVSSSSSEFFCFCS